MLAKQTELPEMIITPYGDVKGVGLKALWERRELVLALALRSIRTRYRNTKLGILWAFAQPLLYMLVINAFFGMITRFDTGEIPYPMHLLTGIICLQFFNKSITDGSAVYSGNQGILSKIYIPPIIFPVASFISSIVDFIFPVILVAAFLVYYKIIPTYNIIPLPFLLFYLFFICFSMYMMMSVLAVRFRDIRMLSPTLTQLLLFASPIFYPVTLIPEQLLPFYGLNPLAGAIEMLRWSVFGLDSLPPMELLKSSILSSMSLFVVSIVVFRKLGRNLVNYVR